MGLPASGKSTIAKQLIKNNPTWVRTNKDDLRMMLKDGTQCTERFVIEAERRLISCLLKEGLNVVVDNTNFNPIHLKWMKQEIDWLNNHDLNIELEVKLIDTSLEECLQRNRLRTGKERVPDSAILAMYNKYLTPKLTT